MKITAIETIRVAEFPNLLWVHVRTDEGLVGLGETFYGPGAAEAHIHDTLAPALIGQDPLLVDRHHRAMTTYVGFVGSSAEMRGLSAIDIALWDLWGQATGQPIHQLLGGRVREEIRVYNTCAGYRYVQDAADQGTGNFGLPAKRKGRRRDDYEDLDAFLHRADELAESLLEMGITGMKIWPFDYAAEASHGAFIGAADLKTALAPFAKIRRAVGDRIDVMAELHGLWLLPPAKRIAAALEEYDPLWVEDPVRLDHLQSLEDLAAATTCNLAVGETLGGRAQFRWLLEQRAVGLAILDLSWCGGLSEARKVAAMAESFHMPVAFHDCTGPVVLAASTHLALNAANAFIQEMVRAFYYGWYGRLVTALPPVTRGMIRAPEGPGLGLRLLPDVPRRPDARVRRTPS